MHTNVYIIELGRGERERDEISDGRPEIYLFA